MAGNHGLLCGISAHHRFTCCENGVEQRVSWGYQQTSKQVYAIMKLCMNAFDLFVLTFLPLIFIFGSISVSAEFYPIKWISHIYQTGRSFSNNEKFKMIRKPAHSAKDSNVQNFFLNLQIITRNFNLQKNPSENRYSGIFSHQVSVWYRCDTSIKMYNSYLVKKKTCNSERREMFGPKEVPMCNCALIFINAIIAENALQSLRAVRKNPVGLMCSSVWMFTTLGCFVVLSCHSRRMKYISFLSFRAAVDCCCSAASDRPSATGK